jgi:hypothetical protein
MVVVLAVAIGASTLWGCAGFLFCKSVTGPSTVVVKTYNEWTLCISLRGDDISDVVITDVIPAELEVIDYSANCGTVDINGANGKKATHITWTIPGPISPCDTSTLCLQIATRLSPSGKFWRFTDTGCFPLNQGAHLEGLLNGVPFSDDTNGIFVTVVP